MSVFQYPGINNTYVPQAIAALQTNFSQNPKAFKINQYVTVANVNATTGYYIYHDPTEETRVDYTNMADSLWADGAYPQVNFSKGQKFVPYLCKRYHDMFTVGDLAAQQAEGWNVIVDHSNSAASNLMTKRTSVVLTALTTTGNWGANTDTATSLAGGYWSAGTDTTPYIQISIQKAVVAIQKATNATINPEDLVLVISPDVANAMAKSAEIRQYFKSSFVSKEYIGQGAGSGFFYGLPDPLYGVRVIVEDRVKNTAPHGSPAVMSFILGKDAFIVARPGSLTGSLNTMSTVTLAMYQDMQMVLEHKNIAQLTEGVVWDMYDTIVRPESGFLITAVIA